MSTIDVTIVDASSSALPVPTDACPRHRPIAIGVTNTGADGRVAGDECAAVDIVRQPTDNS